MVRVFVMKVRKVFDRVETANFEPRAFFEVFNDRDSIALCVVDEAERDRCFVIMVVERRRCNSGRRHHRSKCQVHSRTVDITQRRSPTKF